MKQLSWSSFVSVVVTDPQQETPQLDVNSHDSVSDGTMTVNDATDKACDVTVVAVDDNSDERRDTIVRAADDGSAEQHWQVYNPFVAEK